MIRTILVVGLGTMGRQIIDRISSPIFNILVYDNNKDLLNSYLPASPSTKKLKDISELELYSNIHLVIEAVTEDLDTKIRLYNSLDRFLDKDTIIASNTSSLDPYLLAEGSGRSNKFITMHFFNPVDKIPFVELGVHFVKDVEIVDSICVLLSSLGIKYQFVEPASGFVVNKILFAMINSAITLYFDSFGYSSFTIDSCLVNGAGFKSGPLKTADIIGLDVVLKILKNFYIEEKNDAYKPHYLFEKMVKYNKLGKKSGEGFYIW